MASARFLYYKFIFFSFEINKEFWIVWNYINFLFLINIYTLILVSIDYLCLNQSLWWLQGGDFLSLYILLATIKKKRFFPFLPFIYVNMYSWILFYSVGYIPLLSLFILILKLSQICHWETFQVGLYLYVLLTCCHQPLCTSLLFKKTFILK